jgi:predicted transcriptional regulator
LVKRDLTEDQIKADILNRLVNSNAFGAYHIPSDQMRSFIQNKIKRDGKTVSNCINELARQGLIIKTARNTIYADHARLDEIYDYIDKNLV